MNAKPDQAKYKATIREISDRIVEAQREIRILDAIKWDPSVQERFFAKKFKEQDNKKCNDDALVTRLV